MGKGAVGGERLAAVDLRVAVGVDIQGAGGGGRRQGVDETGADVVEVAGRQLGGGQREGAALDRGEVRRRQRRGVVGAGDRDGGDDGERGAVGTAVGRAAAVLDRREGDGTCAGGIVMGVAVGQAVDDRLPVGGAVDLGQRDRCRAVADADGVADGAGDRVPAGAVGQREGRAIDRQLFIGAVDQPGDRQLEFGDVLRGIHRAGGAAGKQSRRRAAFGEGGVGGVGAQRRGIVGGCVRTLIGVVVAAFRRNVGDLEPHRS